MSSYELVFSSMSNWVKAGDAEVARAKTTGRGSRYLVCCRDLERLTIALHVELRPLICPRAMHGRFWRVFSHSSHVVNTVCAGLAIGVGRWLAIRAACWRAATKSDQESGFRTFESFMVASARLAASVVMFDVTGIGMMALPRVASDW
jgi:hypothetical protein